MPLRVPPRSYLREMRELRRYFQEFRPAVIHTHGYRADFLGGLVARRLGIPQASTAHGFTGGGLKNLCYEWIQLRSSRRADAVVAVSRSVQERLSRAGVVPSRLHLIPNALPIQAPLARAEARARLGIAEREVAIGWVGRISPEKGVDVLLRALARLPATPWTAHIVGDGPSRALGERLARELGLIGRIRWHGIIQDAGRLLAAFDVLTLTSRTEGTPVVLLEAARASVPVVATAVGGVPDMYGPDEALLVPSDRPDLLAEAIASALASPEVARERAGQAATEVPRRFDPGRWISSHEALYARLQAVAADAPT